MGRPLSKRFFGTPSAGTNTIKVQFHNGTASVPGYIVEQTGSKRFKCRDADGNEALCYLKDKASADLEVGEMSITFKYDDGTVQQARKISRHVLTVNYNGVDQKMPWNFSTSTTDGRWQIEEAGSDVDLTDATDLEEDDGPAGYTWTAPSGWAGYEIFNGTSQRLSVPASSDWAAGTGAFTIEFVTNFQAGGGSFPRVFSLGSYPSATVACSIEGGATPTIYFWINGAIAASANTSGPEFTGMPSFVNNFHHVVLQRNTSGHCNIYIDGNKVTDNTTANTTNLSNTTSELAIAVEPQSPSGFANWMKGYLTNFRWTNAAVYPDTSFPVMSAALTALPQTKLLLLMASSGALNDDSSGTSKVVTATGTPTWSAA
jgi:hypothetical protein